MTASQTWNEALLERFAPDMASVAEVSVVVDPDNLLTDERILGELVRRGYHPLVYAEPIAFRLEYETTFTPSSKPTYGLVVVFRGDEANIDELPFDLLSTASKSERVIKLSLLRVLPELDLSVVRALEPADLQILHGAVQRLQPGRLGRNATLDFALRNVFGVSPERLYAAQDVCACLMDLHMDGRRLPGVLADRVAALAAAVEAQHGWPVRRLLTDRQGFIAFLENAWGKWLCGLEGVGISTAPGSEILAPDVPFAQSAVRMRVDTWFLDGVLSPVRAKSTNPNLPAWAHVGVRLDGEESATDRCRRAWRLATEHAPTAVSSRSDWAHLARLWGDFLAAWSLSPDGAPAEEVRAFQQGIDDQFSQWLHDNYGGLASLSSASGPVMVHHALHFIAKQLGTKGRAALLVVDGLALDQWSCLREPLARQLGDKVRQQEDVVWAWVPTLTSISRQAIFRGQPPFAFANTLETTSKESKHFETFWDDHQLPATAVAFRVHGTNESFQDFAHACLELAGKPKARVLGLVANYVDSAAHGAADRRSLHDVVRGWAGTGQLADLVGQLVERGFTVYLTADHGNVEAVGAGAPSIGKLADHKGDRALWFPNPLLLAPVVHAYSHAQPWPSDRGLPPTIAAAVARDRSAFLPPGRVAVCHGGAALEEVAVPFVTFWREPA